MKIRRHLRDFQDPDIPRQQRVQCRNPADALPGIKMKDLSCGMHARIRSSAACHRNRMTGELLQGFLQHLLNAQRIDLPLPAGVVCSIILDHSHEPVERMLQGTDRCCFPAIRHALLSGCFRHQKTASRMQPVSTPAAATSPQISGAVIFSTLYRVRGRCGSYPWLPWHWPADPPGQTPIRTAERSAPGLP